MIPPTGDFTLNRSLVRSVDPTWSCGVTEEHLYVGIAMRCLQRRKPSGMERS